MGWQTRGALENRLQILRILSRLLMLDLLSEDLIQVSLLRVVGRGAAAQIRAVRLGCRAVRLGVGLLGVPVLLPEDPVPVCREATAVSEAPLAPPLEASMRHAGKAVARTRTLELP